VTTQEPPQRIGFVGLGQMGAPMARNLARAGFKLAVTDTNAAAVKRLGDTGFNESAGRRRKRELLRPPRVESLQLLGVDPGEVRDVTITHLHYHHVGNFDRFPKASRSALTTSRVSRAEDPRARRV
jgi:glyoxylase-like metal-dependent hydrolase (beta-lactamase superfamily II)